MIGGLDLGLERAGMHCAWQVEINDYARRILEKHWPAVRRWDDVRTFPPQPSDEWRVDLVCGGFPCQDISNAGKRKGFAGERSGLWREFAKCLRVLRPRYVLVENVAALLVRGLGRVLGDLAALGYDSEWDCLSAAAFGAPHLRERVFIVAYAAMQHASRCDETSSVETLESAPHRGLVFSEQPKGQWSPEPALDRVVARLPSVMDRLNGLGNAVVPAVAEWVGRQIMKIERRRAGRTPARPKTCE